MNIYSCLYQFINYIIIHIQYTRKESVEAARRLHISVSSHSQRMKYITSIAPWIIRTEPKYTNCICAIGMFFPVIFANYP